MLHLLIGLPTMIACLVVQAAFTFWVPAAAQNTMTAGDPWRPTEGRMVWKLTLALGLMAVCVSIHTAGITCALRWLRATPPAPSLWRGTRLLIRLAAWIILLHLVAIITWGLCYTWTGALSGVQTAVYFSAVTYTTTGYGDLTLPEAWRLVGAVEALTGILMCGLSTGFFFAVMSRLYQVRDQSAQPSRSASEPS